MQGHRGFAESVLQRLAFACLLLAGAAAAQDMPPARVEVATAVEREMSPVVAVSGTVVSLNDSRIASEVEGVLTWLADVGDPVEAGNVIARVDPRIMRIALTRAEAEVYRLEAESRYRERQLERTEELAATNNASATLLDEARAQRDQVLHQLADARAQLERARGDLARASIRAPFAGHVTERLASVGEFIAIGEDVVRLVDTHRIEISLPAPIDLASFLRPGMTVPVEGGGEQREYAVRAVVPVGDAVSRMVEVRLDAGDSDWLVGTPVKVSLPNDTPVTTVAVPRDALVERGGSTFIYRVGDDGSAEQVPADVRSIVGLWVGVSSGIAVGDRVIVRGAERLAPGQPVAIIDSASRAAAQSAE